MNTDTSPMDSGILYSENADIGVIEINRPQARNALNWSAQEKFSEIVDGVQHNSSLRVLIITGAGDRAFASGGDLKELAELETKASGERLSATMGDALAQLTELSIPVIGAINGDAVGGGCEILTACDLRIGLPHVEFRFAQIQVGLTTGWGGTARLIHLVGMSRALDLLLTGRTLLAEEAHRIGFVQRLTDGSKPVVHEAREWAHELRELPSTALSAAKKLAWQSVNITLKEAYKLERTQFSELWPHEDHLEAMAAFNQKRKPRFNINR